MHKVKDYAERADWDRALTASVAEYKPDLVISAGFLKLVGDDFLAAFGDRYINTHNALLPAFPGIHGPRDALEYGVKVAGATLFFVDGGVDTGPIIAPGRRTGRGRRHRRNPDRADQGGRTPPAGGVGRPAGPRGLDHHRTKGSTEVSTDRRPIRRALISVYDKTGLEELAKALSRGRRPDRVDRLHRGAGSRRPAYR